MSKTELNFSQGEGFVSSESEIPRTYQKTFRWTNTQPNLIKSCLLCNSQIQVKYIPPKKRYSLKNNWGYWTQKEENKQKYLCNSCLLKLYDGNINDWIPNQTKADVFYNYVKRGQF